jgi:hypothetical protein
MTSKTRRRTDSLTPGRSLTTFETVIFETPASRATSLIVTRAGALMRSGPRR